MSPKAKIVPFLWYAKEAEEAAKFYAKVFPETHVDRVTAMPAESPSGPPGSVKVVELTLLGQPYLAMSAATEVAFNHAVSFTVYCEDQSEVDRYWSAILEGGGKEEACGWIRDRWGVSWQIVPRILPEMMASSDQAKAKRASEAMMKMVKLDVAALKKAFDG